MSFWSSNEESESKEKERWHRKWELERGDLEEEVEKGFGASARAQFILLDPLIAY